MTAPGSKPVRTIDAPPNERRRITIYLSSIRDAGIRREAIALGLVMLCAFALRVIWLDTIPGNITADEADNLRTIFRMQVTGDPGLFGLDWKPQPALTMYLFAGFMAIFGDDIFGMRMASAVLSTLALLPFYALARRVVQPVAALGGAALLATGLWYMNFSRSGWENVHVAFYALLAAWALTIALERKQLRWFAVAGVAAAFGLYGYFAGRMILAALLVYAPLAVWWAKGHRRTVLVGYGVLALTALLLFTPQIPAIDADRDTFNRRTDALYVFHQPRPYLGQESDFDVVRIQVERNLSGFFLFDGDVFKSGRYGPKGKTLYDPVTGVLLIAGLIVGLQRWRQTGLWWAMLMVPLLAIQIPSINTPNGARALIVAPFMYLFVALTLDALIEAGRGRGRQIAVAGVVAGVVLLSAVNVHNYFDWIQSPETLKAREPAVQLADYELWRAILKEGFATEGPDFHVREWNEMVEDLRESERDGQSDPGLQGTRRNGDQYQP